MSCNLEEKQYLDLIKNIIENGCLEEGRNGNTVSTFGASLRFSLKDGKIPIITTKSSGTITTKSSGSKLSVGAIVGIVVGLVALGCIIFTVICCCCCCSCCKKLRNKKNPSAA